jgi:hypothetical protein
LFAVRICIDIIITIIEVSMSLPITVRPATQSDLPLIANTIRHVDRSTRLNSVDDCWVCVDEMEPDTIYGFLWAPERLFVGYIFTKEAFRGFGVARSLTDHVFGEITSRSIPAVIIGTISRKTAQALRRLNISQTPFGWFTHV